MDIAILLAAAAVTSSPEAMRTGGTTPSPVSASVQARATIRVLNGAVINEATWKAQGRKTERDIIDKDGRTYRLHITDFE